MDQDEASLIVSDPGYARLALSTGVVSAAVQANGRVRLSVRPSVGDLAADPTTFHVVMTIDVWRGLVATVDELRPAEGG